MSDPLRVAIHFTEDGNWTAYADDGVEVYSVCDASPSDRVYRMAPEPIPDGLIGGDVGHKDDGSAASLRVQRFVAEANGERHLRVVPPTPQSGNG